MGERSTHSASSKYLQNFAEQEQRIRLISKELLSSSKVGVVIGFRKDDEGGSPIPLFARTPEQADKLIWTDYCWRSLAPYFKRFDGKMAVVAKSCDARALLNLIAENQLVRENIIIIGVECGGMLNQDGELALGCVGCTSSVPPIFDYPVAADGGKDFIGLPNPQSPYSQDGQIEQSSNDERQKRFLKEIDKCILCYSCRQACPGCYCEVCFVDRKMTNWHQRDVETGNKVAFHLTRAMHLAGRCVSCGACENVCASGVSLKYIYDEINSFIEEEYGFRSGVDLDAPSAMNDFSQTDRDTGFLGGEGL